MAIKSLTIIIDKFSDRIFDLGHDNVHLYDFGYFNQTTFIDNYYDVYTGEYSGYSTYDDWYAVSTDTVGGFYSVSPNTESGHPEFNLTTTNNFDWDLKESTSFIDSFGLTAFADTFYGFNRADQTSDAEPNHGDWALAAYLNELEDPDQNEIICIDLDTLNGPDSHYSKLFSSKVTDIDFFGNISTVTAIEKVIQQFYQVNDKRFTGNENDDEYSLSCLSISIAGSPATQEIATLNLFESVGVPIIQAAPNVNSGDYDWGSNYPDVINVGAWNVDNEDNWIANVEAMVASDATASAQKIRGYRPLAPKAIITMDQRPIMH